MSWLTDAVDSVGHAFGGGGDNGLGTVATIAGGIAQGIGRSNATNDAIAGLKGSKKLQRKVFEETAPARQQLIADATMDPSVLQPFQTRSLDDTTRAIQAQLASSGGRAAGRGGLAAAFDAIARAKDRAVASNQQTRDLASTRLATIGYGQVPGMARTTEDIGATRGYGDIAAGNLIGSTTGQVFGLANAANKQSLIGTQPYSIVTPTFANEDAFGG